jgi:hypothetical protein
MKFKTEEDEQSLMKMIHFLRHGTEDKSKVDKQLFNIRDISKVLGIP